MTEVITCKHQIPAVDENYPGKGLPARTITFVKMEEDKPRFSMGSLNVEPSCWAGIPSLPTNAARRAYIEANWINVDGRVSICNHPSVAPNGPIFCDVRELGSCALCEPSNS